MTKDLDYYMNLPWTLIEGTDLDFNGNPYYYIEIKMSELNHTDTSHMNGMFRQCVSSSPISLSKCIITY